MYVPPNTIGTVIFDAGFTPKQNQKWDIEIIEAKGRQRVTIKSAQDFIEWKLRAVETSPQFLGLPRTEQQKFWESFTKEHLPHYVDFQTLPKTEQAKVIGFLTKSQAEK